MLTRTDVMCTIKITLYASSLLPNFYPTLPIRCTEGTEVVSWPGYLLPPWRCGGSLRLGRGVRVGAVSAAAARLARVVRGGAPEHAAQQPRAVGQRGHRRPQRGHRVSPADIAGVTFYLYRAMGFYSQRSHLLLLRLPRPSDCLNWSSLLIV